MTSNDRVEVPPLTEQLAVELSAPSRRHSRLLALGRSGADAVAVWDCNGDGAHSETAHLYVGADGRWQEGGSSGGGTPDLVGPHGGGSVPTPDGRELRWAYGRAERPGPVAVPLTWFDDTGDGPTVDVVAGPGGWWVWMAPAARR